MKKKLIFAAGGTGGHLFPAQTVAHELKDHEILFVGANLSKNRYFDQTAFPYKEIASATFSISQPKKIFPAMYTLSKGFFQAKKIFDSFRPDLVVGFGSFFTLPVLVMATLQKTPLILHEQNAYPGRVNRFFSRFAEKTAITFPESKKALKGDVELVAFPLRKKTEKKENFGLKGEKPILLLFGGSQGAKKLNSLFLESASHFKKFQIIHFTGDEKSAEEAHKRYTDLEIDHYTKAFEPNIDHAMKIASIAVTRAGAATIKELIEYELPSLLIPFPFASENHQEKNGEHFVNEVSGGYLKLEKNLAPEVLVSSVETLFQNRLEKKKKIQEYKMKNQLKNFSQLIMENINNA